MANEQSLFIDITTLGSSSSNCTIQEYSAFNLVICVRNCATEQPVDLTGSTVTAIFSTSCNVQRTKRLEVTAGFVNPPGTDGEVLIAVSDSMIDRAGEWNVQLLIETAATQNRHTNAISFPVEANL